MMSRRFTRLCEDVEEEIFLSIEDWHEPVQINLGPNVGDITTGRKPPRRGRVIPIMVHCTWSPWRQTVVLNEGPWSKDGLSSIDVNRHWYVNLCCKIERAETEPDTFMSRPWDSVNRRASTHVYKDTTRRQFRTTDNNSRPRQRVFAPWSSKP